MGRQARSGLWRFAIVILFAGMKLKSGAIMLAIALGLPAIILYNIFFHDAGPVKVVATPGFEEYKRQIESYSHPDNQILNVIDEGGQIRVNVLVKNPSQDRLDTRIQATNLLYDMQSLVGREISISVWTYRAEAARPGDLLGMAFFRSLTEQQGYKSAEELR